MPEPRANDSARSPGCRNVSRVTLGFGIWGLGFGIEPALPEFRSVSISGRARAENPSNHHAQDEHAGDVDEMRGGRHQVRLPLAISDSSRSTSRCTFVRRRPTDTRDPINATHTN